MTQLAEQLHDFIKSLTKEDAEYMMKYDRACLEDAVNIISRISTIKQKLETVK